MKRRYGDQETANKDVYEITVSPVHAAGAGDAEYLRGYNMRAHRIYVGINDEHTWLSAAMARRKAGLRRHIWRNSTGNRAMLALPQRITTAANDGRTRRRQGSTPACPLTVVTWGIVEDISRTGRCRRDLLISQPPPPTSIATDWRTSALRARAGMEAGHGKESRNASGRKASWSRRTSG